MKTVLNQIQDHLKYLAGCRVRGSGRTLKNLPKRKDEIEWVEELKQAMYLASKRNFPSQIKSTFNSFDNEKKFRPILYRVDYGVNDDSMRFYILFVIT